VLAPAHHIAPPRETCTLPTPYADAIWTETTTTTGKPIYSQASSHMLPAAAPLVYSLLTPASPVQAKILSTEKVLSTAPVDTTYSGLLTGFDTAYSGIVSGSAGGSGTLTPTGSKPKLQIMAGAQPFTSSTSAQSLRGSFGTYASQQSLRGQSPRSQPTSAVQRSGTPRMLRELSPQTQPQHFASPEIVREEMGVRSRW